MIAVILAAGYGTRLYPLAEKDPKALLPVNGKPILRYLLDKLEELSLGLKQVILVSNHKFADKFQKWLEAEKFPIPWKMLDDGSTSEENRLGSIGDLVFALKSCTVDDDLLLLGSDNLFPDPLTGFAAFAREKSPGITLGAYELPDRSLASRYGVLTVNSQWQITGLEEKPANPTSSLISMAAYFFPRNQLSKVLEYDGSADTLGSFIHWLVPRQAVFAYRFQGPWLDIGDMNSYTKAQELFIP